MITRSKLVEQLRDYQIRSQHKWVALFNPISPPGTSPISGREGWVVELRPVIVDRRLIGAAGRQRREDYRKLEAMAGSMGVLEIYEEAYGELQPVDDREIGRSEVNTSDGDGDGDSRQRERNRGCSWLDGRQQEVG